MNVSVYLLDAALSGDDLALKQLNDILEEHKLNKMPEIKFNWRDNWSQRSTSCWMLGKPCLYVYERFNHDSREFSDKWSVEINSEFENIPYNTKEEAMRAAEKLFLKRLYE
jgi:hypothetical protein